MRMPFARDQSSKVTMSMSKKKIGGVVVDGQVKLCKCVASAQLPAYYSLAPSTVSSYLLLLLSLPLPQSSLVPSTPISEPIPAHPVYINK